MENAIQVNPPPPSVRCYKTNNFYISCTGYGPELCSGGGGRNLVKAVFMCEWYCPLAANSIQQHVKRGSVPKPFGQELGSLMGSLGHYVIKILLANKNFTRHFSLTRNHNKKRFTYTFHLQLYYSIKSIKI